MSSSGAVMPPAVILAGGKGTRLGGYAASFPKPLVPVGDVPILEILLTKLKNAAVTNVTLTLGPLAELIQAYLSQRPGLLEGLNLQWVRENTPLGTAGSLSAIRGLTETFFVINGDLLTSLSLSRMQAFHRRQKAVVTVGVHSVASRCELGVVEVTPEGMVCNYTEKPVRTDSVSMGIYLVEPAALDWIEPGEHLEIPALMNRLIAAGQHVAAFAEPCRWLDIGNSRDYAAAQQAFEGGAFDEFTVDS